MKLSTDQSIEQLWSGKPYGTEFEIACKAADRSEGFLLGRTFRGDEPP